MSERSGNAVVETEVRCQVGPGARPSPVLDTFYRSMRGDLVASGVAPQQASLMAARRLLAELREGGFK